MSETKSILKDKSFAFAIEIVKTYKVLVEEKKEYVMSKQLLRSGTSVGAHQTLNLIPHISYLIIHTS